MRPPCEPRTVRWCRSARRSRTGLKPHGLSISANSRMVEVRQGRVVSASSFVTMTPIRSIFQLRNRVHYSL